MTNTKYTFLVWVIFGSFEEMECIFIVKNLVLVNFFTVKVSGYDVIRCIFGTKNKGKLISSLYVCMAIKHIIVLFVETPRKFITAKLSIRKPGSSSVLIIYILLALMKIRAYGSKALQ